MKYKSCAEYEPSKPLREAVEELLKKTKGLGMGDRVRVFVHSYSVGGAVQLEGTLSKKYEIAGTHPVMLLDHSLDVEATFLHQLVTQFPQERIETIYLGIEKIFVEEPEPQPQEPEIEVEEVADLDSYEPNQGDDAVQRELTPEERAKRDELQRRMKQEDQGNFPFQEDA